MNRTEKAAPLLALIRKHESDSAVGVQSVPSAYDVVYGGIPKANRPKDDLTSYTVGEVIEWQQFVIGKGAASSAAGGYQFIRKTLMSLNLPLGARFDADCQDGAALMLLDRRGWDDCENGRMTPEDFADMLAREWASLPVQRDQRGASRQVRRGQSYYAGDGLNKAHATPEEVMVAVRAALVGPASVDPIRDKIAAIRSLLDQLEASLF
jgi:muramidase (phage lysozyme)